MITTKATSRTQGSSIMQVKIFNEMKLVILFGPGAVGKMTVGKALAELTELKLFHNHMSLELANQFFPWSTEDFNKISELIRFGIFDVVAKSDLEGLIFTFVWVINEKKEEDYIDRIVAIFEKEGADVCFVELYAELEQRLKRNKGAFRLQEKLSKRDTVFTEKMILKNDSKYKLNTEEGDLPSKTILKIDNTHLSAEEVAKLIKGHYML